MEGSSAFRVGSNAVVLQRIFEACTIDTLKTSRLVCQPWRNVSVCTLQKRTKLFLDGKKYQQRYLSQVVREASAEIHRNISVTFCIPEPLPEKFRNLVSLQLDHVVFEDMGLLRKTIFHDFSCMEELTLGWIRVRQADQGAIQQGQTVRKLVKLKIRRQFKRATLDVDPEGEDAFNYLTYDELFANFPTVKELDCGYSYLPPTQRVQDIFAALFNARIQLHHLTCWGRPEMTLAAMNEYWQQFGRGITHVGGEMAQESVLETGFRCVPNNYFVAISMTDIDWSFFGNGVFECLTEICVTDWVQTSLEFLDKMPCLQKVTWDWEEDKFELRDSQQQLPSAPCAGVCDLTLSDYYIDEPICDVVFYLFPNVKKLKLKRYHDDVICGYLQKVCETWPELECLEFDGPSELAGDSDERSQEFGGGNGNILDNQMKLVVGLKFLKSFIQYHPITRLRKQAEYFGNKEVFQGFCLMPNLTCVRLEKIAMTEEYINVMKLKLHKFEYTGIV